MRTLIAGLLSLLAASAFVACESDSYDSGTGEYSLVTADFAEVTTDRSSRIVSFVTDNSDAYTLATPATSRWATTADSTYRVMLYYNKVGSGVAELVSISSVPVLGIIPRDSLDEIHDDPITLESVWKSKNGRYINIGLYLKTGETSDTTAYQSLGISADSLVLNADGTTTMMLTLFHDQGTVPEYYSQKYYLSIRRSSLVIDPRNGTVPDSVYICVNTYGGKVNKAIILN